MLSPSSDFGGDIERGRRSHLLFDFALLCRKDQRIVIFFGEFRWHLDFKVHSFHQSVEAVGVDALNDANPIRRQIALAAETEHVDAGACAQRRQENRERCRRYSLPTPCRGLIR